MGFLASRQDYALTGLRQAAVVGSVLASFCVEDFGTERVQEVTLDELWSRYEAIREMVTFGAAG